MEKKKSYDKNVVVFYVRQWHQSEEKWECKPFQVQASKDQIKQTGCVVNSHRQNFIEEKFKEDKNIVRNHLNVQFAELSAQFTYLINFLSSVYHLFYPHSS